MAGGQTPKKRAPGGGRKRFKPDDTQRLIVSIMAACGMPHAEIARQITNPDTRLPISEPTLRAAFREELAAGKSRANAMVAQSLFNKAMGEGKGAVAAAIFWLKTQARWKEPPAGEHEDDNMPPESKSFTYNVVDGRKSDGNAD